MRVIVSLFVLVALLSLGACARKMDVASAEAYSAAPMGQSAASAMTTEYRMQPDASWSVSTSQPENEVVQQGSQASFEAARSKADRLGGVHLLTQSDIEGLSYEQIQRLRGY